jgi:hypothetical protein
MKCPHCSKELVVPNRALHSVEAYGKPALSVTECCGNLVRVGRIVNFSITKYTGNETEDSWGVPVGTLEKRK